MPQTPSETIVRDGIVRAGLVGRDIALSRTPAMHEAEGRAQGIDLTYRLFDLDDRAMAGRTLADVVASAEAEGFAGLNVTYPYKIEVIPLLHDLSQNARAVGAVNTIVFRNGRRKGHNTDLWGFCQSFRSGMAGAPLDKVLLLGAGGAGGAVAHALLSLGVGLLWIFDTDPERAARLVDSLSARFGAGRAAVADSPQSIAERLDGVVNATPVGTAKHPGSPFPAPLLRPEVWVADIVYFPLETSLLASARAAGCRILSGLGMAVFQAVRAYELFTGRKPDPLRMRRTFEALGP
ncbi:MAG TPA: shikimate dehydrogenase [Kiloniellales bacterium]|nr:shikimate dehydrogenase [Kiloniellales bacterium]